MNTIALLDLDIYTFRAAFSAEDEEDEFIPCSRVDKLLEDTLAELDCQEYEGWLSGKNNFRYKVYPEYKSNRINVKRPKWEQVVKQHLVESWAANYSNLCEADDMLGVRHNIYASQEDGPVPIIVTIDKDLDTIPGWHYNFVKKDKYFVTPKEALRTFYYQCLVGDAADNIKGAIGIGPVKARKLLDACESEEAMHKAVLDCFSCEEEFLMTAKCIWIWHKIDDIYSLEEHAPRVDTSTT